MQIDHVPLLRIQRELHDLPRGRPRFSAYIRTILNEGGADGARLPLVAMNPMGRDHVTALLDDLLALDADRIAAEAVAEAVPTVAEIPGSCKLGLVIADDLMGGWTNRFAFEFTDRFGHRDDAGRPRADRVSPIAPDLPRRAKHSWLSCPLWSSEPASVRAVRESVLATIHRLAYLHRHGPAMTLRDRLAQEGHVLAAAGCEAPVLDADDLAYTREAIAPFLDAADMRTAVECLFGDEAARTLGFTPRGLSPRAGLALALNDARRSPALAGRTPFD
ncbi:hypothetical protein OJF2_06610 [Aquisphaera giovannonii]|uniref:Uncharacterized protein n=1 Tax=Aquisphaera giovannonii TaxID=406548 RepID=A0A5B9VVC9_9BACT|nr:hypothetical protein [Aquisphaera giovannonii]QEH32192.1 hypothetical protein OJF2_06610 [Aquisphaera giovannonii]